MAVFNSGAGKVVPLNHSAVPGGVSQVFVHAESGIEECDANAGSVIWQRPIGAVDALSDHPTVVGTTGVFRARHLTVWRNRLDVAIGGQRLQLTGRDADQMGADEIEPCNMRRAVRFHLVKRPLIDSGFDFDDDGDNSFGVGDIQVGREFGVLCERQ